MKCCCLVLLLALLGARTTRVSGAVATSGRPYDESNLVVPSMAMLGRCPKTCGNLSFAYPFGIGSSCFRDPDFNLTCVDSGGGTTRLFLRDGITEVVASHNSGIEVGWSEYIGVSCADAIPVVSGVDVYNMSSWSPPGRSFLLFDAKINVTGCGFDMLMLEHDMGTSSKVCSITCPDHEITETTARQDCNGTWCCSVPFWYNHHGFQFRFEGKQGPPHKFPMEQNQRDNGLCKPAVECGR